MTTRFNRDKTVAAAASLAALLFALEPLAQDAGTRAGGAQQGEQGAGESNGSPAAQPGDPPPPATTPAGATCNEQAAQAFLIRTNYVWFGGHLSAEERRSRRAAHERAIRYRTEHYGYYPGFGSPEWNPHPPTYYVRATSFFHRRVRLNQRVIPALACVEAELHRACASTPYQPGSLAGIRERNTYHTGEITNHAYGIAIDVDPDRNTCCHCVAQWANAPLCRRPFHSVYERMAMPECWVHVFERYGFYWLGHDPMQDTMHFEFLGDPDAILPGGANVQAAASTSPAASP